MEKSPEVSVTTAADLASRSYNDSFYEEMDWEPMEDEKITFEVITNTLILIVIRKFTSRH